MKGEKGNMRREKVRDFLGITQENDMNLVNFFAHLVDRCGDNISVKQDKYGNVCFWLEKENERYFCLYSLLTAKDKAFRRALGLKESGYISLKSLKDNSISYIYRIITNSKNKGNWYDRLTIEPKDVGLKPSDIIQPNKVYQEGFISELKDWVEKAEEYDKEYGITHIPIR